jgi:hypothetical protein
MSQSRYEVYDVQVDISKLYNVVYDLDSYEFQFAEDLDYEDNVLDSKTALERAQRFDSLKPSLANTFNLLSLTKE